MTLSLPKASAEAVDTARRLTPALYQLLSNLTKAQNGGATSDDVSSLKVEIAQICQALGSPDGTPQNIPERTSPTLKVLSPLYASGTLAKGFMQIGITSETGVSQNIPQGWIFA